METCHALARRGHHVRLVVRPTPRCPPRDAWALLRAAARADADHRTRARARVALRAARGVTWRIACGGRSAAPRPTPCSRGTLTIAGLLLRVPASFRPPVVYESHGYAPAVAEDLPAMISGAAAISPAKRRRLEGRSAWCGRAADGYATITAALARELELRFGPRTATAVVPDGTRIPEAADAGLRQDAATAGPSWGTLGTCMPGKALNVLVAALGRLPGVRAIIVGGLAGEPDLAAFARWPNGWRRGG